MERRDDVAAAGGDTRFPPAAYFVASGIAIAAGIGLSIVHKVLIVLAPLGLLAAELVRRKRGYLVKDRLSLIALNAPLPGTMAPVIGSTLVVLLAMFIAFSAAPSWAVIAVGAIAGSLTALLMRRSELRQLAGIRRLERASEQDKA